MKVKITKDNLAKLQKVIDEIEGKSYRRRISAPFLLNLTEKAEDLLDMLEIPVTYRSGAVYEYCPPFDGRSKKWSQSSTKVTIERMRNGWYLTDVNRVRVSDWHKGAKLMITEAQDNIAVTKLRKHYSLHPSPEKALMGA